MYLTNNSSEFLDHSVDIRGGGLWGDEPLHGHVIEGLAFQAEEVIPTSVSPGNPLKA